MTKQARIPTTIIRDGGMRWHSVIQGRVCQHRHTSKSGAQACGRKEMDKVETITCDIGGETIPSDKIFATENGETVCEICYRVDRSKREIIADVEADTIPAPLIRGFADLHDYVDANEYGGLCEDRDIEEEDEAFVDMASEVQERVHQWILRGDMLADILKGRGHDVPTV